MQVGIGRN